MRILVDVGHPAHVHFYKHAIWRLQDKGHEVLVSGRNKDVTLTLLDHYGFAYRTLSCIGHGRWGLSKEFLQREWALLRLIREFNPDVVTEIGGLFIAPVCKLVGKPSIVFTDTEHVALDRYLTHRLASVICTPACFMRDLGRRQIRYAGYHELAYLHPHYFQPDPTVLDELGVSEGERFIVLRFVAWTASHDLGQEGLSPVRKRQVVRTLSRYGKVFITSEGDLPAEFKPYEITIPPHRIHDALALASLYLGEGATMATEACLLDTPSVYVSSLVGTMGNFIELMERYELVYSHSDPDAALRQAVQLLEQKDVKVEWGRRREKLLAEKVDVTDFVADLLASYVPEGASTG
jgi:predicted glycosyltransferase